MQLLQQILKATLSPSVSPQNMQLEIQPWYPVRLLALYRLFIAILLGGLFSLGELGGANPSLFISSAAVYLFLSILWLILIYLRRPGYRSQVYAHITSDIVLLGVMTHASGGVDSGPAILLIVNIGGAVLLLGGLEG
jgi:two-component system sensor histidine kinase PilS (NtrC family)